MNKIHIFQILERRETSQGATLLYSSLTGFSSFILHYPKFILSIGVSVKSVAVAQTEFINECKIMTVHRLEERINTMPKNSPVVNCSVITPARLNNKFP